MPFDVGPQASGEDRRTSRVPDGGVKSNQSDRPQPTTPWLRPALELVDRLGLAVSSVGRFLALAPITNEELIESVKRCEPALMRLIGART